VLLNRSREKNRTTSTQTGVMLRVSMMKNGVTNMRTACIRWQRNMIVCLFQWSTKTPAKGDRIIIGSEKVIENSLKAEMRPGNMTPINVMMTMWVRRSPSWEIVFESPRKRIPFCRRRLNMFAVCVVSLNHWFKVIHNMSQVNSME
jgi:hypothetical protein